MKQTSETVARLHTELAKAIRQFMSKALEGTDEEHPLECNIVISGPFEQWPNNIDGLYKDDEGNAMVHLEDDDEDTWQFFDDFYLHHKLEIVYELSQDL